MKKNQLNLREPLSSLTKITKEQIQSLPLVRYEGPIELICNSQDLAHALKDLKKEKILGFDTESRPSFKKGVHYPISLIQLAAEKKVFLIQPHKIDNVELLKELWESTKSSKVGIAIHDDIRKLKNFFPFHPTNFIDISDLTKQIGIQNTGLRPLVGMFLGVRISKTAQTSNWAQEELTSAQVNYASTDAWIGRELFLHLQPIIQKNNSSSTHSL